MKDITKEYEVYIKLISILTDLVLAYKNYAKSLEERLEDIEQTET